MHIKESDGIPDDTPPMTAAQTLLHGLFWLTLTCMGFGSLLFQLPNYLR